jgi:polyphenol oxidase
MHNPTSPATTAPIIRPNHPLMPSSDIAVGSSTRNWESMSYTLSPDDRSAVFGARLRFIYSALGGPVSPKRTVFMNQIHGSRIRSVHESDLVDFSKRVRKDKATSASLDHHHVPATDGLSTQVPAIAIVVYTADCLPIVCYDTNKRAIAVIHAGWPGLEAEIVTRLVVHMKSRYHSRPSDLAIWIGPCIKPCCYGVGDDFAAKFRTNFDDSVISTTRHGRVSVDLVQVAMLQLVRAGVQTDQVSIDPHCTSCNNDLFPSHRAEGESRTNTILTVAMLPVR